MTEFVHYFKNGNLIKTETIHPRTKTERVKMIRFHYNQIYRLAVNSKDLYYIEIRKPH